MNAELQPTYNVQVDVQGDLDGDDWPPTATVNFRRALTDALERMKADGLIKGYEVTPDA